MAENTKAIGRLVDAITEGVSPKLMIAKQDQLAAEQSALSERSQVLQTELASLLSTEQTRRAADITRIYLMQEHKGKDWCDQSYDEIKQFLFHLFGAAKFGSGNGIFIRKDDEGRIHATFKGQVEFQHYVVDGRPISKIMALFAEIHSNTLKRNFDLAVWKADMERDEALAALGLVIDELKPCTPFTMGDIRAWSGSRQSQMGNPGL